MSDHVYIGVKPCGCIAAVVVDDEKYPEDTAQAVSDFIRDGYKVERIERAKLQLKKCEHGKIKEQLARAVLKEITGAMPDFPPYPEGGQP